ncbi:hypothetical protein C8J57DRAFT_1247190 [Mycena rebaudengoi]|nr:hypothetical protein C8J57DRAFT_1247190 [Mycena rebaudengoi]
MLFSTSPISRSTAIQEGPSFFVASFFLSLIISLPALNPVVPVGRPFPPTAASESTDTPTNPGQVRSVSTVGVRRISVRVNHIATHDGCVVAGRLAYADPNLKVILIEGGANNRNDPWVYRPGIFIRNMQRDGIDDKATFYTGTMMSSHMRGRKSIFSINFQMYTRLSGRMHVTHWRVFFNVFWSSTCPRHRFNLPFGSSASPRTRTQPTSQLSVVPSSEGRLLLSNIDSLAGYLQYGDYIGASVWTMRQ